MQPSPLLPLRPGRLTSKERFICHPAQTPAGRNLLRLRFLFARCLRFSSRPFFRLRPVFLFSRCRRFFCRRSDRRARSQVQPFHKREHVFALPIQLCESLPTPRSNHGLHERPVHFSFLVGDHANDTKLAWAFYRIVSRSHIVSLFTTRIKKKCP